MSILGDIVGGIVGFYLGGPEGAVEGASLAQGVSTATKKPPSPPPLPRIARQPTAVAATAYVQRRNRTNPGTQVTGPQGAVPTAAQVGAVQLLGQ
jgi:hypothetical protein